MRTQLTKITLAATIAVAITFTFNACSSDSDDPVLPVIPGSSDSGDPSSSDGSSSSGLGDGSNQTPAASDYAIGKLNQTAGSVVAITIVAQSGKSPGAVSNIRYNGSTDIPQTAAIYSVLFDVAEAPGWNAATDLLAGSLVVTVENAELAALIADAENLRAQVKAAEAEEDVAMGVKWVEQSAMTAFESAISAARTASASAVTQAAVNSAKTVLEAAMKVFMDAWQDGTKADGFSQADVSELISYAYGDIYTTSVSANGNDVPPSKFWVSQSSVDALYAAIDALVAANDASGQTAIDAAYLALVAERAAFNAAKQHGTAAPVVHGVTISPKTAIVAKGTTKQFTVKVLTSGDASNAVIWSITTAGINAGTTIRATGGGMEGAVGTLTVSTSETKTSFTIRATSAADNTKFDEATVSLPASVSESQDYSRFDGDVVIDPRDNKAYKYEVASNGRVWMSENLNYSRGGTLGYCYKSAPYDRNLGTAGEDLLGCNAPYGRNYTYDVATEGNTSQDKARGICPKGWHIPDADEWKDIKDGPRMSSGFYVVSGNFDNGDKAWKSRKPDGGGFYWISNGEYHGNVGMAIIAGWSNQSNPNIEIRTDGNDLAKPGDEYYSVRCIMDENFTPTCGGQPFNPATEYCSNNTKVELCGGKPYDKNTHTCENNIPMRKGCQYEENSYCPGIAFNDVITGSNNVNGNTCLFVLNFSGCSSDGDVYINGVLSPNCSSMPSKADGGYYIYTDGGYYNGLYAGASHGSPQCIPSH